MKQRLNVLIAEFAHHLPYTIVCSLIAMGVVWYVGTTQLSGLREEQWHTKSEWFFHILHPMHLCLSAIATTSVFWRHERRLLKAVLVGFVGAMLPCGLSDYIFPFLGGKILGQSMELHICLIEHPVLVLQFTLLGILAGLLFEERMSYSSVFSHGAHVFVSSLASLCYLVSFGLTGWMSDVMLVFPVFLIIVVAVWIPCCISDIVIPVAVVHERPHGGHRPVSSPAV